jgi:hypothetical protein
MVPTIAVFFSNLRLISRVSHHHEASNKTAASSTWGAKNTENNSLAT